MVNISPAPQFTWVTVIRFFFPFFLLLFADGRQQLKCRYPETLRWRLTVNKRCLCVLYR